MRDLLIQLKREHEQVLDLARELEGFLPPPKSNNALQTAQLRMSLERLTVLLAEHGKKETDLLFPELLSRLPKSDHWQVRMLEIQDEAIGVEARHLLDWCTTPTAPPLARVREHGVRLVRWLREHVAIEEERLFPRLKESVSA
ncbi:MAG TPA: hemerythrin domain-containing protein [Nitrospiria bacterium]|nr:hemerythrin domain-containing protein [Nitrospiria bacterium]